MGKTQKKNFRSFERKYAFLFEDRTVQMIWFHGFNDEEPASTKFLGIYEVAEILNDLDPAKYPRGYCATHNFYECIYSLRLELLVANLDNVLYIHNKVDDKVSIEIRKPLTDVDMLRMLNLVLINSNTRYQLQPMWLGSEPRPEEDWYPAISDNSEENEETD